MTKYVVRIPATVRRVVDNWPPAEAEHQATIGIVVETDSAWNALTVVEQALVDLVPKIKPERDFFVCGHCGSDDVEFAVPKNPNTNEIRVTPLTFCNCCDVQNPILIRPSTKTKIRTRCKKCNRQHVKVRPNSLSPKSS